MTKAESLPSQEMLNELLAYDPENGTLAWKARSPVRFPDCARWGQEGTAQRWNTRWAGKPAFTNDTRGYRQGEIFGRPYFAHRIIWRMVHGDEPADIDHIDGNRSNNRLSNLRAVTRQENLRNARRRSDNSSGVVGVTWDKRKQRWYACIAVSQRTINLGSYRTLEEATAARKAADRQYGFHENHGRA
jgi:hypothetical protein